MSTPRPTSSENSGSMPAMARARELVGAEALVIDMDPAVQRGLVPLLAEAQLHVTCIADPAEAVMRSRDKFFAVVLVDLDTPTPGAGIGTIAAIRAASPTSMIIALTPRRSYDDAVAAVRAGAIDLILKAPESVVYLKDRVLEAVGRSVGRREVDHVLADVRAVYDDFLQRFVDAERRAMDAADRAAGRDPARTVDLDELRVLIVDEVDDLYDGLAGAAPPGYVFQHATSGGEALDRASSGHFHYAMVAEDLSDLPASILVRSIKNQNPELVVLTFLGPADNGKVELVETVGSRVIVQPFRAAAQLVERLDELAQAWRAKARERRYTQAFRERHYDFLRRYVELRTKIGKAINDGPG
jgi:DNA-binding response OmpR family regulator